MRSDYSARVSVGLAIVGGTFDPVHFGHLRSALEAQKRLGVSEVRLIPSFRPPHRGKPGATTAQRLAMLELATRDVDCLRVDNREIQRQGLSYTVDTLASIRAEIGSNLPLSLVIGEDAYALLHTWHNWPGLIELAHLVILKRPAGHLVPAEKVAVWAEHKRVSNPECLGRCAAGLVINLTLTQFEISATKIRELIEKGEAVDYLLPESVIDYIHQHGLYQKPSKQGRESLP